MARTSRTRSGGGRSAPEGSAARRLWEAAGPLLAPFSWPYAGAALLRRRWWRFRAVSLPAPVVSVGNITCGGTGKTPVVEMVVRDLAARGCRPAILSRGYGAPPPERRERTGRTEPPPVGVNDEYLVLAENLPGVPHYVGTDRVAAGRRALANGADTLVLDDGFQHVRLERDLDFVLIDALDPFGPGRRCLPAGLLREPIRVLRHADLVGITRIDLVERDRLRELSRLLERRFPAVPRLHLRTRSLGWKDPEGGEVALDALRGEPVLGFSGIGNPAAFRRQLAGLGVEVREWLVFRDHHRYTPREVARLAARASELGAGAVVMTQKDAVKLRLDAMREAMGPLPWLYLGIAQTVEEGEDAYRHAIEQVVGSVQGRA